MDIPTCETAWRTDTGNCITQTVGGLPTDILSMPGQIKIETNGSTLAEGSKEEDNHAKQEPVENSQEDKQLQKYTDSAPVQSHVTLTISPTPIASTIQITANFPSNSGQNLTQPQDAHSSTSQGHLSAPSSTKGSADDVESSPRGPRSSQSFDHGKQTAPSITASSHNGHPPHPPRRSGSSTSHTFLYRWFHPGEHHETGSVVDSTADNSREGSISSSESISGGSKKNTLVYRLLHPNEHQHHHHHNSQQAQSNASGASSRPLSAEHGTNSRTLNHVNHEHTEDEDVNCIVPQPPKPTDSPQTHRKYALLQKLFHHVEHASGESGSPSSTSGFGSSFHLTIRKHRKQSSSITNGLNMQGSNEHSDTEVSSHGSNDNLPHAQEKKESHLATIQSGSSNTSPVTTGGDSKPDSSPADKKSKRHGGSSAGSRDETGSLRRFYVFKNLLATQKGRPSVSSAVSGDASHQSVSPQLSSNSITEKYGQAEKIIGKGAGGTVRLFHKLGFAGPHDKLYAVKEFRKRRKNETEKDYIKKLTSEFCISSNLHHTNIVETIDLVQDENHRWCEIMEYVILYYFSLLTFKVCWRRFI